jgi:hypothetical protein
LKSISTAEENGSGVEHLSTRWDNPRSRFGDFAMLAFFTAQVLDGIFTYVGVSVWGPTIEANPLVSSAVAVAGLGAGLTGVKAVAIGLGMLLHLRRLHNLVALLTAIYVATAILPWTAIFLFH